MRLEVKPGTPPPEYQQGLAEIRATLGTSPRAIYRREDEEFIIETKAPTDELNEREIVLSLYHTMKFNQQGFQAELMEIFELSETGIETYYPSVSSNFLDYEITEALSFRQSRKSGERDEHKEISDVENLRIKRMLESKVLAVFRSMRDYPVAPSQTS